MSKIRPIHTFERYGKFFAVDIQDTFCFECDRITSEVLQYYPENTQNKIVQVLSEKYSEQELLEVVNELEYLRSIGSILKHKKIETWAQSLMQNTYLNTLSFLFTQKNVSKIENIISRTLLCALPYVQANQKFQINLWFNEEREVFQEDIRSIIKTLLEKIPVQEKSLQINLYLLLPALLKNKLKINEGGELFLVFSKINSEVIKQIEDILKTEFQNLLNIPKAYILYFPTKVPFNSVIERLLNYGVKKIILDPFAPLVLSSDTRIDMLFQELLYLTKNYTQQFKKGNRYILEPIMQLFLNIQNGNPIKRQDPAGAQEWLITPEGDVYGGYLYYKKKICKMGNIIKDEIPLKEAEGVYRLGVNTMPACINCWAQNFCGGGHGALHHRFTGKVSEPSTDWCDAQRQWIEEIIVQYQELNNVGIALSAELPITSDIQIPGRITVLKHIFRSFFKEYISIRPLRPQDEEWLAKWETWNDNIYFTLKNENILTTTHHEKEQEILNTTKNYEEWAIVDKKARPRGLLRIQPHTIPNLSVIYIYFHNPDDYLNKDIQNNFQSLFNQIKTRFPQNRWLILTLPEDVNLISFIEKLQFQKAGILRDALFLHNQYHPINVYIA